MLNCDLRLRQGNIQTPAALVRCFYFIPVIDDHLRPVHIELMYFEEIPVLFEISIVVIVFLISIMLKIISFEYLQLGWLSPLVQPTLLNPVEHA